ncbi:sensor histidine kinase [Nocardioides gilvus]|uniref:sensor histidine kinase n=1 Tax=Nocardioides gilvus TaxID=1735589 RepID=UPI0013A54292|nr:HAMP domain-containing sensor histidine kinase [Nocardioides gilvus]
MPPHTSDVASAYAHDDALKGVLLEALLHDTTLAVAASDAAGTVTMMSPGLEALVNSDFAPVAAEQIPEHFRVYTEDGSRLLSPEEEPVNRARSGESFRGAVMSLRTHDDHFIHLRCSGAPLRAPGGEILGGIVLFDDITAERAVLREQAALRDRLVETVNHQLRTPLTSLLGHAELLEDLLPGLPAWAARSLTAVIRSGRHLDDLVRAVSDLVDLDAAQHLKCESVDVGALVSGCVERSSQLAAAHGVDVSLSAPAEVPAELDGKRFAAAVSALVTNAVEFSPSGSEVEIEVSAPAGHVRVEIADAGPGISPLERQRLLLPFERGSSSLTAPTGRGLGLAVAHAVAVAHRGTIEFEDNAPTGLRVRVEVPRVCATTGGSDPRR